MFPRTLLVLPVLTVLSSLSSAQIPFPVDKTSRLDEIGERFKITGRVRIPRSVSIEAMRAMTIEGEGEDATLEIVGAVKMRAATGGEIEFHNVWVEFVPGCKDALLANCTFKGKGGIRPSKEGPSDAKLTFEHVEFERSASMTFEASNGNLLMDRCHADGALIVRGLPRSETTKCGFTLAMYGCSGKENNRLRGIFGDFTLEGVKDATVRACDFAGSQAVFRDNRGLTFDGNNVRAQRAEFASLDGAFEGVKITKTDFRAKKLVLSAPRQEKKTSRLTFETCYFGGLEDLDTLRKERLEDSENSQSGVVAVLRDVRAQPNGFGGNEN